MIASLLVNFKSLITFFNNATTLICKKDTKTGVVFIDIAKVFGKLW